ncbi:hypothetical protein BKA67DRAFT_515833 [Truncatella angustata]|uniref:OTU domain-containing protein n=1 Tax=Truncatella angustata TaxID=152316 RepID=A0A9P8UP65_9PEZI|nr:uncharacterized protein BKA67DRAFT_515833 [Truncatella angustata]KAH6655519.1 hypothetical protein BKA67DRAFT_515833 [Truncatella angustata]
MEPSAESPEALQARHRKEQRDLQSRITSKKKNATKKTRKGVNDECAELERQLKGKQEQELAALNGETVQDELEEEPEIDAVADKLRDTSIPDVSSNNREAAEKGGAGKKRNRQQERMARRRAEQEAEAEAAENEAKNMTDHRAIEKTYLLKEFKANNLVEKEIQPDGHCLFSAIADQLSQRDIPLGGEQGQPPYKVVRRRATDHMQRHRDDFAPFLEDNFEDYVKKIRDTAEWGGQLELKALADVYGVEIKVVQDGRTETIEPGGSAPGERPRIWLAYYRHGYGLGEHYNSLRKAT